MKRAILQLIDSSVKGVDTYTHSGSTWLIFTDNITWVVEYDSGNVLWYNYKFFQDVFNFASIEVVKYQEYITEWFESRILKIRPCVEDTIQNGVKHTLVTNDNTILFVEDTIQNGVKHTFNHKTRNVWLVEDTIQNGVKETSFVNPYFNQNVEETIQNGVKRTQPLKFDVLFLVEDVTQNGVKETVWRQVENYPQFVDNVIDKGVKETQPDYYNHKGRIEGVILKNKK